MQAILLTLVTVKVTSLNQTVSSQWCNLLDSYLTIAFMPVRRHIRILNFPLH